MNINGVEMNSAEVGSAIALLQMLANPEQLKKALQEAQVWVKAAEAKLAEAKKIQDLADVKQIASEKIAAAAAEKEAAVASREKQLATDQGKLDSDKAAFVAERELHGKWHKERTEYFERERVAIDRGHAEVSLGKKEAAASLALAKEVRDAAEALRKQFEQKLAEFRKIAGS